MVDLDTAFVIGFVIMPLVTIVLGIASCVLYCWLFE